MDSQNQPEVIIQNSENDFSVQDDPEDDAPVSNETDASNALRISPEFGEAGPPPSISGDIEIEPGIGYKAIVKSESAEIKPENDSIPLDAWYGEIAHPDFTRVLRRVQPPLRQTVATEAFEIIIDNDDRVQITDTKDYPWRCICALNITAKDGSRWIGTGWFAGPRTIITAGHCVYMNNHGGWVSEIKVTPGGIGEKQWPNAISQSFQSVKGWTLKQKRSHDYGAIILPPDDSLGELVGAFGYICLGDPDLQGLMVNLGGFPGDKIPWPTLWFHARPIASMNPRTLVYMIDTMPGQSGAPVWRLKNGERHVVGIHTNGDNSANSGTRIAEPVFNNIKRWAQG